MSNAEPHEIADLLERGADYMDAHGFCKGVLVDRWGQVCAVGALRRAGGLREGEQTPTLLAAMRVLSRELNLVSACFSIAEDWNDLAETTQEDVTTTFRKVAIKLREQVQP